MPLEKQSLNNFLPNGFETLNQEGYKKNFNEEKIKTGYEKDMPDIVSGPNLNNLIDVVGKNTNTLNNYVNYLNNMPINNIPTVNANGQLDYINNNFLNKNQITNCILEAPNGVIDVSGLTVTLKQGVKVLIPNGLNADRTLKNYELNIPQETSRTLSSVSNAYLENILIKCNIENGDYNLTFYSVQKTYYNENKDTLLSNGIQYVKSENQWYEGQNKVYLIPLGIHKHGTSLDLVRKYNVLSILKQNDSSQISGWGMPSDSYIDLTLGVSSSTYTAPANGFVTAFGNFENANGFLYILDITGDMNNCSVISKASSGDWTCAATLPIRKGHTFEVRYNYNPTTVSYGLFRFYYAEGEV